MNSGHPRTHPPCEAALRFMDSIAQGRELSAADQEILNHLKACPDCAKEFAVRTRIAEGLKHAVEAQPASPYLEARIRRSLREPEPRFRWAAARQIAAVVAVAVLCVGILISYRLGHFRWTRGSQEAYFEAVSGKVARIMGVGLGDHVHCAFFQKLPKESPSTEVMVAQLGPQYSGLLPLIRKKVPADYKVVTAHRCSYHGRKFVHLALKGDGALLSVILTRRADDESFEAERLAPALAESGMALFDSRAQSFSVAGFETSDYLVYVISDLGRPANLQVLVSIAEPVRALLAGLQG